MHWRKDITKLLWPEKKYKFSKLLIKARIWRRLDRMCKEQ